MANISKVNFNGNNLDVKDAYAREQILHKTANNYVADVAGDYAVNAGDYAVNAGDITMSSSNTTMHTTADRTIDTDGNDSVHIDGASTLNVGGLRTERFAGDKTETVTGTETETAGNRNTTVTGKWSVNLPGKTFDMKDVALQTDVTTAVNAEAQARENADAALSERIENITGGEKRVIIALGDSLGAGINTSSTRSPYGWLYKIREKATKNLTVYTNLDVVIEGNSGFASTAPFLAQIKEIVSNNNINTNDVTDIIIFSGTNDCAFINTTLGTALDAFFTYIKATFKNANLRIGTLTAAYGAAKIGTDKSLTSMYRSYTEKYGYKYIPDVFNLCLRKKYLDTDNTHLINEGYKTIYPFILECALNGSTKYSFYDYNEYANGVQTKFFVSESGIEISVSMSADGTSTYIGDVAVGDDIAQVRGFPNKENILCNIPYIRFSPVLIKMNNELQIGDYYIDGSNKLFISLTKSPGAPSHSGTAILMAGSSTNYISSTIIQN